MEETYSTDDATRRELIFVVSQPSYLCQSGVKYFTLLSAIQTLYEQFNRFFLYDFLSVFNSMISTDLMLHP